MGDYLFDAIVYLLKYSINYKMIRKYNMSHLQECLTLGTPKVLKCHRRELKFEFLHDFHHGKTSDEKTYIIKLC